VEPNTPFGRQKDRLPLPQEEETADLYENTVELLSSNGFIQYEISNFAKPGYRSRHNLKYWHLQEYLGLGPAAHSFLNGERFYYPRSLTDFVEEPHKTVSNGPGGGVEEYIEMSLRLVEGLDFEDYKKNYGGKGIQKIISIAEGWQKAGLCSVNQNKLALTPKGFLVSNSIISEVLYLAESDD